MAGGARASGTPRHRLPRSNHCLRRLAPLVPSLREFPRDVPLFSPTVRAAQMPRNNELKKILLIGSGPIVIGQGCEFDYSGVQACKALREEGYQVVLVNSNPATIMTDPEFADRTYIEPITAEVIEADRKR